MRNLFYYYQNDALIFKYRDDCGKSISHRYIFYSLREAIRLFREQYNLKHKKIQIKNLNMEDKK